MGLFSSETVITVGTSISRLIEDKNIKDPTIAAVAAAVFQGTDVVDNILEYNLHSMAIRAEAFYRYAENPSNNAYGMPSGEVYANNSGTAAVTSVLTGLEGAPVSIIYNHYGPINVTHAGWMYMVEHLGYNPKTNELTALSTAKGKKVYLKDMSAEVPLSLKDSYATFSTEIWGIPANSGYTPDRVMFSTGNDYLLTYFNPTPVAFTATAPNKRIKVSYVWDTGILAGVATSEESHVYKEETAFYDLPTTNPEDSYFHVKYLSGGSSHYWIYKDGAGIYPSLDNVYKSPKNVMGEFFPNIYYRLNKVNPSADKSSTWYKQGKALSEKLGVGYSNVVDKIHENPDISQVEQAFLTMGIPAITTNQDEAKYLFDFFKALSEFGLSGLSSDSFITDLLNRYNPKYEDRPTNMYSLVIKDAASTTVLTCNGVVSAMQVGAIGAPGFYKNKRELVTGATRDVITQGDSNTSTKVTDEFVVHTYQKQVGLNWYEEVRVVNLRMHYLIHGSYLSTIGVNAKDVLLVPLDRSITKDYSANIKNLLYTRSLNLICNSYVETKLAWYETEFFGQIIKAVGIVLTILSLGSDGGFFSTAAALLADSAYIALVNMVIMGVVKMIVTTIAFRLFVKAVGMETAFVAALFAALYGYGQYLNDGQMTASAKDFIGLANNLVKAASANLADMYKDLMAQMSGFSELTASRDELLKSASDILEEGHQMNPLILIGESPDQFYNRTVHSGNIGTLLLDDVHSFVDRSLTLPKISTTLGGSIYG